MERKDFFEVVPEIDLLELNARSADSTLRWASAIELSQLGTEEAISILWSLTTDADDYVRDAANLGLQQCDQVLVGKVLATKWSAPEQKQQVTTTEIAKYNPWKVRPLEAPLPENEWAVDAAVLNIIQTEAPMTGSRLLRIYGNAVYPNNPKKLQKSRIQSAIRRLEKRKLVGLLIEDDKKEIEYWTLYCVGSPEVVIREQGHRKLKEIPVTEVIARLQQSMGDEFSYSGQNERFKYLMSIYGIKQSELHILGDVCSKEWSLLLSI